MSELVSITLLTAHRVLGSPQAEGAQCVIHAGVADDLIKRGIAKLTNEPTDTDDEIDGGE